MSENTTLVSPAETVVRSPAPVAVPAEPPPDRRIGAGMLLAIGVLGLVAVGLLAAWLLTHRGGSSTTTVVVTTSSATNGTATAPRASAGAALLSIPDVAGLRLPEARARLAARGLRPAITPVSSSKPSGTIVEQAPRPGTKLAKGSSVTLLVSAPSTTTSANATTAGGAAAAAPTSPATSTSATTTAPTTTAPPPPRTASMPDVTTQDEATAVQALAQAGVLASIAFVPGTDVLGTVEQQAKPAGATLPYHAHVQINVSRGPSGNPLENVPDVIGKDLQEAVSALQAAQLRLIYVKIPITSRARAGRIVQQSPLVGASAPQNGQVVVFLGAYRAPSP